VGPRIDVRRLGKVKGLFYLKILSSEIVNLNLLLTMRAEVKITLNQDPLVVGIIIITTTIKVIGIIHHRFQQLTLSIL